MTGSLGKVESKLEDKVGQVATLAGTFEGQASEVLGLKEQLDTYQTQLETSTLGICTVKELLDSDQSQRFQRASTKEALRV